MFQTVNIEQLKKYKPNLTDNQKRVEQFVDTKLISDARKICERLTHSLEEIEKNSEKKDYSGLSKNSKSAILLSERLTQMIRQIPINYGQRDESMYLNGNYDILPEDARAVTLQLVESDVLEIILRDLLPKRQDGKMFENRDYIRFLYTQAFHTFFKTHSVFFRERAVILFKNIFLSEKDMIDDDNFDTKIITDCIATYVLSDDNPKRCMKIFDYGIGETRHTEILIFPESKWNKFMDGPYW